MSDDVVSTSSLIKIDDRETPALDFLLFFKFIQRRFETVVLNENHYQ